MSLFTLLDVKVGKSLIQTSIHTPIQDDFITNVHDVINRQQMQLISHYQCVSVVCVVQQLERGGFFSESISKSALFPSIHDAVLHCLCLSERDQSRSELPWWDSSHWTHTGSLSIPHIHVSCCSFTGNALRYQIVTSRSPSVLDLDWQA